MSNHDSLREIEDPMIPDTQKENSNETIIFGDHNSPTTYYRGKRTDMQLLVNEGGAPYEVEDPKVNKQGQIHAAAKWDEDTGNPTEIGWLNVNELPDYWKENEQK